MLVDYPFEWNKYMLAGKIRTFKKETPADVVEKAKIINKKIFENTGKNYFSFEGQFLQKKQVKGFAKKEDTANGYYDGHYKESEFSLEEIEKQLEEEKKRVEQMTEWEDL